MSVFSVSNRKIDPSHRPAAHRLKPDKTPDNNDRVEIGPTHIAFAEWEKKGLPAPDITALRTYRHQRIVEAIQARGYAGILLFDPLNIRYASDAASMQVWTTHNPARACLVLADGYMVLWDFFSCEHMSAHLPLVREVRHGASLFYFEAGDNIEAKADAFAAQVLELMQAHSGENKRLAIDKIQISGLRALDALGVETFEGQELTEHARMIKDANELDAMRCAIHSCERSIDEMRAALKQGISEDELWAHLHYGNIRRGGEWIEARILSSGPRTNPWYQESGPRIMSNGELVAFDTDMIGVYGYCCDLSRTWLVGYDQGMATPTREQKELYKVAYEHIQFNKDLLRPGMSFAQISEKAHVLPEIYRPLRYCCTFHGVGLCDEFPAIRYREDFEDGSQNGTLEVGMCLCVEAYVGALGGSQGVKLEEQLVITENGCEMLSEYPFEDVFLS